MDFADDVGQQNETNAIETADAEKDAEVSRQDKALVAQICRTIKADKKHHERAFKRMRRDMQIAMWGADKDWGEERYRANIAGRHVKQKTAALYAKNPRAVARRKETLDFAVWDENPASLMLAYQTIQMGMQAVQLAQTATAQQDPLTGAIMPAPEPQLPPGFEQAQATMADFQQGMARRTMIDKIGKTMEILFSHGMREQKPIDFKRAMKKLVRRACTTSVGYVELGFQREYGPRPGMTEKLADARVRLDHMRRLAEEMAEGEMDIDAAERAELEHSVEALMSEPEILLREGLIFDFPQSTKVIPDKLCKSLDGFVGARHMTIEYVYTVDEVKELFDVDVTSAYTSYTANAGSSREISSNDVLDDDYEWSPPSEKKNGMVLVWKYYDKPSGLVYYLADGHPNFLRKPAPPDVFVEDFWPIYALTFNDVESEDELFPPSDVSLMLDMQKEHNRSRQGKREHREAARPRWVFANGSFGDEDDPQAIRNLKAFEAVGLNIDPTTSIQNVLQTLPVPGVDPNLYDTNEVFTDTQLVVGTQEAQFGGVAKATATESAIAANSTTSSDGSAIDDLDSFLTTIARASGQIMLREYSAEKVAEIAGPGAVWPELTLAEIADEVFLEVEAGSTGKPNQAVEINNWKQMLPLVMQLPNIDPYWLARETLRRLDDRMDLTAAIAAGIPSIVSMNQQSQMGAPAGDPASDPAAQGPQGANNAPQPPRGEGGTGPSFGSNQVASPI
jgi:hypothetical protein